MSNPIHSSIGFFDEIEMGIGTWAWGDRVFWGYGKTYGEEELEGAFDKCVDGGIRFFDTSEAYGTGQAEIFLGKFLQSTDLQIKIASKFMPYPWRIRKNSLNKALQASLKRLGRDSIDLYQINSFSSPFPLEFWIEAMIEAKQAGLVKNIGIANCDQSQMLRAQDALGKEGIELASNQVEFNLLDRKVEKNGLLQACRALGIKLIAYSPIAQGALSGKYSSEHPIRGMRASKYSRNLIEMIQPLIDLMKRIGIEHHEKTPAQVALNWVIRKGALPIPGVKTVNQAAQNLGALAWSLSDDEMALLDQMSDKVML